MKRFITIAILVALLMMVVSNGLMVSAQTEEPTEEPTLTPTATETPTEESAVESTVEPTEEPTAELTEEPTVEPTEEPTAEPTEEPTVEPTEEPTVEPTEEPTVEPTEEPTPEPTEEPIVEPTEEPIVEPTEEPTVEPTEEPTAEPTKEPTVEPTVTLTPTVEAAGEAGAAAVVGSWTTEYIGLQNIGESDATVSVKLYNGSTTPAITLDKVVPQGGGLHVLSSEFTDGRYSGVIESSVPLAAAALNANYTYKVADMYLGTNSPVNRYTLPLIFRDHSYWRSKFYIQNTTSSAQTAYVNVYRRGESTPSASASYSIEANNSITIDFMDSAYDAFGSGSGAYGSAVITGTGNLAVVHSAIKDPGLGTSYTIEMMNNGFPENVGGREVVVPLVFNGHSYWYSGINFVNLGSISTTLTLTFYETTQYGYGGGTYVRTMEVGPREMNAFYFPEISPALPRPTFGSARVTSSSTDIVAIVTHTKYPPEGGFVGFNNPALNPSLATTKIAIPLAFKQLSSQGWLTGVNVMNLGGATSITTRWVRAGSNPSANTFTITKSAGANEPVDFYAPEISGIPDSFSGMVYVESSTPIMAVGTFTRYSRGVAATIPGYNY